MLSWMMAQWIKVCREKIPSIDFVFPVVPAGNSEASGVPTLDWIETLNRSDPKKALLPAITNRVMAQIPVAGCPQDVAKEIREVTKIVFAYGDDGQAVPKSIWRGLADQCLDFLQKDGPPFTVAQKHQWHFQLRNLWQVAWQLWPDQTETDAWALFKQTPLGADVKIVEGNAWHPNYQLAGHRLDARRHLRDFSSWTGSVAAGASCPDRDAFSGKEEAVLDKEWHEKLKALPTDDAKTLQNLFRSTDPLGAPMAVKRVWHKAYLEEQAQGFDKKQTRFIGDTYFNMPSLPAIAAYPWALQARKKIKELDKLEQTAPNVTAWDDFVNTIYTIKSTIEKLTEVSLPQRENDRAAWFNRVDWELFQPTYWAALLLEAKAEHKADLLKGQDALHSIIKTLDINTPGRHYAVLAMDGDGMGKWLSGQAETPSEEAGDSQAKKQDPLTEKFHKALSQGLVKVAAQNIHKGIEQSPSDPEPDIEAPFHGKVIYAGADDLLAILPADEAIACAVWFNQKFSSGMGEAAAAVGCQDLTLTASAGIAIGHFKAPLQDMMEVAQANLKIAKNHRGRNALQLTLFKRSGEMIEWGCKFAVPALQTATSPALELLELFSKNFRPDYDNPKHEPAISGRFPYKLAELLRPFVGETITAAIKPIITAEFNFVCSRQIKDDHAALRQALQRAAESYLDDLLAQTKSDPEHPRKVADFIHLFQTEAFLARQD